jgi:hypothetical protein
MKATTKSSRKSSKAIVIAAPDYSADEASAVETTYGQPVEVIEMNETIDAPIAELETIAAEIDAADVLETAYGAADEEIAPAPVSACVADAASAHALIQYAFVRRAADLKSIGHKSLADQLQKVEVERAAFDLDLVQYALSIGVSAQALASSIGARKTNSPSDTAYLAIYALQKVRKTLRAMRLGERRSFDGYTHAILFNMVKLGSLSTRAGYVSMSKHVSFEHDVLCGQVERQMNCGATTASTQTSSTRQALAALGMVNLRKGGRGDVMTWCATPAVERVREMFAAATSAVKPE